MASMAIKVPPSRAVIVAKEDDVTFARTSLLLMLKMMTAVEADTSVVTNDATQYSIFIIEYPMLYIQ